jgi:hypothetical protein
LRLSRNVKQRLALTGLLSERAEGRGRRTDAAEIDR